MQVRASMQGLAAGLAAALLLMGCRGGGEDLATPDLTPEPIEPAVTDDPIDEDPLEEPEAPEDAPIIFNDDDPLFAPLPELTPDPDNDIPDDLEVAVLRAVGEGYGTIYGMASTAQLDEDALGEYFSGQALESAVAWLSHLREQGLVERNIGSDITRVWVRGIENHMAITRECVRVGPGSGLYDPETQTLVEPSTEGEFARDRRVELIQSPDDDEPRWRVTEVIQSSREGCE